MPHDPRVLEMHNSCHGRVFIIGNGPSLLTQASLLKKLAGEATFTCNGMPFWNGLPFLPTYHGNSDIQAKWGDRFFFFEKEGPIYFNVQFQGRPHNERYLWVEKAPDSLQVKGQGFEGLRDELPPLPTGRTTPLTLAQVAAWLGYREFYFLGVDMSQGYVWNPGQTSTVAGLDFLGSGNPRMLNAIQECFIRARQDVQAQGGAMWDCTPGGFLNATGKHNNQNSAKWMNAMPYRPLEEVLR